jgi:hypothetical protein
MHGGATPHNVAATFADTIVGSVRRDERLVERFGHFCRQHRDGEQPPPDHRIDRHSLPPSTPVNHITLRNETRTRMCIATSHGGCGPSI